MKVAEIQEIYYFLNIISFVVALLGLVASVYIKMTLRKRLVFSTTQYSKFLIVTSLFLTGVTISVFVCFYKVT